MQIVVHSDTQEVRVFESVSLVVQRIENGKEVFYFTKAFQQT